MSERNEARYVASRLGTDEILDLAPTTQRILKSRQAISARNGDNHAFACTFFSDITFLEETSQTLPENWGRASRNGAKKCPIQRESGQAQT